MSYVFLSILEKGDFFKMSLLKKNAGIYLSDTVARVQNCSTTLILYYVYNNTE